MIEYIHRRLITWGDWVVRGRNTGRNGYPKQAAFMRLLPPSEPSAWSPAMDTEAEEVDTCILRLNPTQRRMVTAFYTRTATVDQLARDFGCCKKTLFNRISLAQNELLGLLNDLAAGLPLPEVRVQEAA